MAIEMIIAAFIFVIGNSLFFYNMGLKEAKIAYLTGWVECADTFAKHFALEVEAMEVQDSEQD